MTSNRKSAKAWCRHFMRSGGAMAAVEFGLMLPILMTLFYGVVEVTRYILITQKVEKLAHTVADVTAQSSVTTQTALDQVMAAASDIMNPFTLSSNGTILISSLYRAPGAADARIGWRYSGGGSMVAVSALGEVDAVPTVPSDFTFDDRENVIAAEVFYRFSPLLTSQFFGTTTVYRVAFYKPRLGALTGAPQ